jgi:hypothetical protein
MKIIREKADYHTRTRPPAEVIQITPRGALC